MVATTVCVETKIVWLWSTKYQSGRYEWNEFNHNMVTITTCVLK